MLRHALRALLRSPLYTAAAVFTLALGIGATTVIFSVVSTLVLQPLPYDDPARLINITVLKGAGGATPDSFVASAPELVRWRRNRQLASVGAYRPTSFALTGDAEPRTLVGGLVSAGLFTTLGVAPQRGRVFTEAEDIPDAPVVVISHGLWMSAFNGDPAALGRTLTIDGQAREVIGIMPPGFKPLLRDGDAWLPLGITESTLTGQLGRITIAVARMRPDATLAAVNEELREVSLELGRSYPAVQEGWTAVAIPLRDQLLGSDRRIVLTLFGAVAFLLLLACANVANLTLARAVARRGEAALRLAIGASRWQLVRLMLTENLLLSAVGAGLGVLLARVGLGPLVAFEPSATRLLADTRVDGRVLAFAIVLSVVTAVICAALPALRAARTDPAEVLKESSTRAGGSRADRRARLALMTAQIALTLVLLTGAFAMLGTMRTLQQTKIGFDASGVAAVNLRLPATRYENVARRNLFVTQAIDAMRAVPGVQSASATSHLFSPDINMQTMVEYEGKPVENESGEGVYFRRVTPDYFRTLRIPLVAGRTFTEADRADGEPVAVVSAELARAEWPGQDPVGRRLRRVGTRTNPWIRVVGVVGDVHDGGAGTKIGPTLYIPYAQNNTAVTTILAKGAGDPARLTRDLERAIWSVDRGQPVEKAASMHELLSAFNAAQRFKALLLTAFAVLGVTLAAIGIYGVTATMLAERAKELAVRVTLGARRPDILRALLAETGRWVVLGVGVGALTTLAVTRAGARWMTDGVELRLTTSLLVVLAIAALVLLATWAPIRRATDVSLVDLLRR